MREIIDSGARELAAAAQDIYGANDPLANDRVLLRRVLKAANGDTYAAINTIIDGRAASVAPPLIISFGSPSSSSSVGGTVALPARPAASQTSAPAHTLRKVIDLTSPEQPVHRRKASRPVLRARQLEHETMADAARAEAGAKAKADSMRDERAAARTASAAADLAKRAADAKTAADAKAAAIVAKQADAKAVDFDSVKGGSDLGIGLLVHDRLCRRTAKIAVDAKTAAGAKAAAAVAKQAADVKAAADAKTATQAKAAAAAAVAEQAADAKAAADAKIAAAIAAFDAKATSDAKAAATVAKQATDAKAAADAKAATDSTSKAAAFVAKRAADAKGEADVKAAADAKAAAIVADFRWSNLFDAVEGHRVWAGAQGTALQHSRGS